ncbi:MAG: hypothetical protein BMS9Abin11_0939 [Gammaproteobacteria bacterium]|nr:MAG: hypothetical protein BMS9Abin11_0939 [Gammaproteobacteria bacterium]
MRLFDKKARRNIRPYFIQCSLATLTILLILVFLDVIKHTAIIATLGSSVFLIFALPSTYSSRPRPLLGGYLIAIIIGSLFYFLTTLGALEYLPVSPKTIYIVFGAMAVGLTIFAMAVTDTEHAPAAGMSLSLVLNTWDYGALLFVVMAVVILALIRYLFRSMLVDLT